MQRLELGVRQHSSQHSERTCKLSPDCGFHAKAKRTGDVQHIDAEVLIERLVQMTLPCAFASTLGATAGSDSRRRSLAPPGTTSPAYSGRASLDSQFDGDLVSRIIEGTSSFLG